MTSHKIEENYPDLLNSACETNERENLCFSSETSQREISASETKLVDFSFVSGEEETSCSVPRATSLKTNLLTA